MIIAPNHYSAVVVGGGPAGATTAFELARRGIDVAVLERSKLPRYKLCGGGLTYKAARLLPFDVSPVVHRVLHRLTLMRDGVRRVTIDYPAPLVYTTMRDELDAYLVKEARGKGARVFEKCSLKALREAQDGYRVETTSGDYFARVLVGADGAHSLAARGLGLTNRPILGLGLEAEISRPEAGQAWDDAIYVDVGRLRRGYGWIFAKRDHLSVGAAAEGIEHDQLKDYYERFVSDQLGPAEASIRPRGHFLPLRTREMPIQRRAGLLVGDAAGLVEPLSGEGIYYAIKSGQLAAPEIAAYLSREQLDLTSYQKAIDREIMPQLASGELLSRVVAGFPGLALAILRSNRSLQDFMCQVMRGERRLDEISLLLGPFAAPFNLLREHMLTQHSRHEAVHGRLTESLIRSR